MRGGALLLAVSLALSVTCGLLADAPDSAPGPACNFDEPDDCTTPAGVTSFLQVGGSRSRKVTYDPASQFLGLDRIAGPGDKWRDFQVVRHEEGECFMSLPNITKLDETLRWLEADDAPTRSNFIFGECPTVVPTSGATFVNLRLDPEVDGSSATGWNPSLVDLPEKLKKAFPEGRWLAALRVGTDHCPSGSEVISHLLRALTLAKGVNDWARAGLPVQLVDQKSDMDVMNNLGMIRTWIAVLDSDMRTLARSEIRMQHAESEADQMALSDMRLFQMRNGSILIGFSPYFWGVVPYYKFGFSWFEHEIIGQLEVTAQLQDGSASDWQIVARVDRLVARDVQECPEQGLHAPGPKKNLGFFEDAAGVHALDWLNPVRIGRLNVEEMRSPPEGSSPGTEHVEKICYGSEESPPQKPEDPFRGIVTQDRKGYKTGEAHNGPPLLSVPEARIFLGVGHFRRGQAQWNDPSKEGFVDYGIYNHHYTHFFFALNATAPYDLVAVSHEFCLESAQKRGDCEIVQFVSSIVREHSKLVVGYGVQDCEAYVLKLDLAEVLRWLRPV